MARLISKRGVDPHKVRNGLYHLEAAKRLLAEGGCPLGAARARKAADSAKGSLRAVKSRSFESCLRG